MLDTSWLFLDTPIPYLTAMYLVAYRHDLGRLARPFHDLPANRANWYAVCRTLELVGTEVKPPAAPPMGGTRNLVLLTASASIFVVSIFTSQVLPWYYLCALQALVALPLFVILVANRTGPFPSKPYRDVLSYPRLGTRVRHLGGRTPDKDAAPAKSAQGGKSP
jgi:hypothetical protein